MPVPDVIAAANGHEWHIRFDRVVCRDCDAVRGQDDKKMCRGAVKIRPMAGIRNVSLRGHNPKADPTFLHLAERESGSKEGRA